MDQTPLLSSTFNLKSQSRIRAVDYSKRSKIALKIDKVIKFPREKFKQECNCNNHWRLVSRYLQNRIMKLLIKEIKGPDKGQRELIELKEMKKSKCCCCEFEMMKKRFCCCCCNVCCCEDCCCN